MSVQASGKARLSVVGLGKLGSPLAAVFAHKGFSVIGIDLNAEFVRAINEGRAPVVEPGLQDLIGTNRPRLKATTSWDEVANESDVSFLIVPTPSGADGLFTNKYILEAVKSLGAAISKKTGYHLVVITSTVMPGATAAEIAPALEKATGRKLGSELGLCYNPEFIALGSVVRDMLNPDMILIGQSDDKAGEMLESIYRHSTDTKPDFQRMNLVNAELSKIAVNTYVTTKISYANMIGEICDKLIGADADVVTRAIGTDSRIGRKYLKPAIGYGGPCFPRDNKAFVALGRKLGVNCDLALATDSINRTQLARMEAAVRHYAEQSGDRIAVLGAAYKPNTPVIEESQGVMLAGILAKTGYQVTLSDPQALPHAQAVLSDSVNYTESAEDAVRNSDVIIVTTAWQQFAQVPVSAFRGNGKIKSVIDPWSLLNQAAEMRDLNYVKLGGLQSLPARLVQ